MAGACAPATGSGASRCSSRFIPRVSLEVGYARRWWDGPGGTGWENGVTDNLNRSPSDYDEWVITAPRDSRLPGGGGYRSRCTP